jgi:hypothetical protein
MCTCLKRASGHVDISTLSLSAMPGIGKDIPKRLLKINSTMQMFFALYMQAVVSGLDTTACHFKVFTFLRL